MIREAGLHFYICLHNLNNVLLDEEDRTGEVNHTIHAMDVFFSSVERFSKQLSENITVEKITGSRLHLYITDDVKSSYEVLIKISAYSYCLINFINNDISKYKTLKDFCINIGADYGHFHVFEFKIGDYSEITSIGYVANLAAKLQVRCDNNELNISQTLYEALSTEDRSEFKKVVDPSLGKYKQTCYYSIKLSVASFGFSFSSALKDSISEYANSINLTDIKNSEISSKLDFSRLNTKHCKRLNGIPVFADIRGFTEQFNEDDTNLEEMTFKTQSILSTLYDVSTAHGGIHIQFQGDRELALFHNKNSYVENGVYHVEQTCFKSAVLASMRMIDAVKKFSVQIGVGEDFGKLFATKIGARGEKDNILLGETVITADKMEDEYAGENQVVITDEVYTNLKGEDSFLAKQFTRTGSIYVTTVGYEQYVRAVSTERLKESNLKNDYNGAWYK